MSDDFTAALLLHEDDLPKVAELVGEDATVGDCGGGWSLLVISGEGEGEWERLRRTLLHLVGGFSHASLCEFALLSFGVASFDDVADSPAEDMAGNPLDPVRDVALYDILEGTWVSEEGREEILDAATTRSVFLAGERVDVALEPISAADVDASKMDRLDASYTKGEWRDLHDEWLALS